MRIISGTHRGTRLKEPAEVTRPTSDRVREAIFNVLFHVVPDARVLDLFAGTGALGLEALSRGAKSCLFVENDTKALRCLRDNLAHTKFDNARIAEGEAQRFLERQRVGTEFNLIFADPPYFRNGEPDLASPLWEAPLPLADGGFFVIETEAERPSPEELPHLELIKRKDYGKTSIFYFEKKAAAPEK